MVFYGKETIQSVSQNIITRSSAIADKPYAMLFCKVVEVLQDVLSENVDKKFTTQVPNYYSAFDAIILLRFYN